jgi:hypothetical protein
VQMGSTDTLIVGRPSEFRAVQDPRRRQHRRAELSR